MSFKNINLAVSEIVKSLDEKKIPGIILTIDTERGEYHLACTGKEDVAYIGVTLERIFSEVKEDEPDLTESQINLVRLIFASLVRAYSDEELNKRINAWRKKLDKYS